MASFLIGVLENAARPFTARARGRRSPVPSRPGVASGPQAPRRSRKGDLSGALGGAHRRGRPVASVRSSSSTGSASVVRRRTMGRADRVLSQDPPPALHPIATDALRGLADELAALQRRPERLHHLRTHPITEHNHRRSDPRDGGGILGGAPDVISASALRAFGSDHARATRSANPQHKTQERPPVAITARTQATLSERGEGAARADSLRRIAPRRSDVAGADGMAALRLNLDPPFLGGESSGPQI